MNFKQHKHMPFSYIACRQYEIEAKASDRTAFQQPIKFIGQLARKYWKKVIIIQIRVVLQQNTKIRKFDLVKDQGRQLFKFDVQRPTFRK